MQERQACEAEDIAEAMERLDELDNAEGSLCRELRRLRNQSQLLEKQVRELTLQDEVRLGRRTNCLADFDDDEKNASKVRCCVWTTLLLRTVCKRRRPSKVIRNC